MALPALPPVLTDVLHRQGKGTGSGAKFNLQRYTRYFKTRLRIPGHTFMWVIAVARKESTWVVVKHAHLAIFLRRHQGSHDIVTSKAYLAHRPLRRNIAPPGTRSRVSVLVSACLDRLQQAATVIY